MGMKEGQNKNTALHYASKKGYERIANLLLETFSEEKGKLIEYVMKEDGKKNTAFDYASNKGYEKIVQLLLNVFSEDKDKLIEYVKTKNENKNTALEIVNLLLEIFSEREKEQLIKNLMKENKNTDTDTALHIASKRGHEKIVKLLLTTFKEEKELI